MAKLTSSFAFVLVLHAAVAHAATISILPASPTVSLSDDVTLDIFAFGLVEVVGDFDIDISFDPAALSLNSYSPGSAVGDFNAVTLEAVDFSLGVVSAGRLNVSVVSVLSESELAALQTDPLLLASASFHVGALPPGSSTVVNLVVNALGDHNGDAIAIDALGTSTLQRASSAPPVVPEPGTWLLLLSGLAAARWRTSRAHRQHH